MACYGIECIPLPLLRTYTAQQRRAVRFECFRSGRVLRCCSGVTFRKAKFVFAVLLSLWQRFPWPHRV